jgi:hypothetical protein
MANETAKLGKILRERIDAEEAALVARKAEIPGLLVASGYIDLRDFVSAHSAEKKRLVSRGSFEEDHRRKLDDVSLTHSAASELLIDEMEAVATAPGSSWEDVGKSLTQESQELEVAQAQSVGQRVIASVSVGSPGGSDFRFN